MILLDYHLVSLFMVIFLNYFCQNIKKKEKKKLFSQIYKVIKCILILWTIQLYVDSLNDCYVRVIGNKSFAANSIFVYSEYWHECLSIIECMDGHHC